jgi:hypothetical protein
MARLHGENVNYTLNTVAIEDELNGVDQEIAQDLAAVTAFADVAEEFVEGKYGWSHDLEGSADFAASQGDATIAAMLGAGEVAVDFSPTGNVAGANDPHYTGNVLLENYRISARVNGPVTYRARVRGNGAITRAVA